jgi:hypothetical protein
LYQYIFLSSFPKKDDALNVPGATSTETGVSCELRADGVLRSWAAEACRQAHGGRVLESAPNHGYHPTNFRKNSNRSEIQSEVRVRQASSAVRTIQTAVRSPYRYSRADQRCALAGSRRMQSVPRGGSLCGCVTAHHLRSICGEDPGPRSSQRYRSSQVGVGLPNGATRESSDEGRRDPIQQSAWKVRSQ